MKILKKIIFTLCLFMVMGVVSAKELTLNGIVDSINNGVFTKEYINKKLEEYDLETKEKKWKEVIINATTDGNSINVSYTLVANEGFENQTGSFVANIINEGKTLQSIIKYTDKDEYKPLTEIELHDMLVFWEIESTEGFNTIKEYEEYIVDVGYLNKFNGYFNKCYREEMHACRTYVSSYGKYEYISDVELNEEAANYVILLLQDEARADHNRTILIYVAIFGVVVGLLYFMAKSAEPKAKAVKYK